MAVQKALKDMTMAELDEIIGPATLKAAEDGLAAGVPIVYGDGQKTYREWPDGRIEILHDSVTQETKP